MKKKYSLTYLNWTRVTYICIKHLHFMKFVLGQLCVYKDPWHNIHTHAHTYVHVYIYMYTISDKAGLCKDLLYLKVHEFHGQKQFSNDYKHHVHIVVFIPIVFQTLRWQRMCSTVAYSLLYFSAGGGIVVFCIFFKMHMVYLLHYICLKQLWRFHHCQSQITESSKLPVELSVHNQLAEYEDFFTDAIMISGSFVMLLGR